MDRQDVSRGIILMDTSGSKITNQGVAVTAMAFAVITTFGAFWLSRSDHDLKLMSLTAVLSLGSGLMGVAGTLLVGLPAYKSLTTGDLPPGSTVKSSEVNEVNTPPTSSQSTTQSTSITPK
jgi:hypothetical protein